MIQRCLKMIYLSRGTEITNRNGLLLLYLRKLPELFPRDKIPKASIIVSLTWKLRFTSNSISRSGSGLDRLYQLWWSPAPWDAQKGPFFCRKFCSFWSVSVHNHTPQLNWMVWETAELVQPLVGTFYVQGPSLSWMFHTVFTGYRFAPCVFWFKLFILMLKSPLIA